MTKEDSFLFYTAQLIYRGVSYFHWWLILERILGVHGGDENLTAKGAKTIQVPITTIAHSLIKRHSLTTGCGLRSSNDHRKA